MSCNVWAGSYCKTLVKLVCCGNFKGMKVLKKKKYQSKLQKSSFVYVTYCKLCPLSSLITENVLDVCKPL
ncbi:hypothetical protein Hanom_Chr01g00086831 [Helianthus anomalus]